MPASALDPAVAQAIGAARYRRSMRFMALGLWAYPVLLVAALHLTWFAAWLVLGHMPRPNLDDPKSIGLLVDIPYAVTTAMLVGAPGAMLLALCVTPVVVARRVARRKANERALGAAIAVSAALVGLALLWGATFLLLRMDPWGVGTWYID